MHYKHAYQSEHKGGCNAMDRGRFGGQWGRGKSGGFWAGPMFGRHTGGRTQPPVNIAETDADYVISLFAAGLIKEHITLTVKNDLLVISYPGADAGTDQEANSDPATQANYTYQEYSQRSFERTFRLNDKVITDGITASYADGILTVTMPKNPATNKPAQTITVA